MYDSFLCGVRDGGYHRRSVGGCEMNERQESG